MSKYNHYRVGVHPTICTYLSDMGIEYGALVKGDYDSFIPFYDTTFDPQNISWEELLSLTMFYMTTSKVAKVILKTKFHDGIYVQFYDKDRSDWDEMDLTWKELRPYIPKWWITDWIPLDDNEDFDVKEFDDDLPYMKESD